MVSIKDADFARQQYFSRAIEYHVTARYGAFAGLCNVGGILFHHAVEMYLKGGLRRTLNDDQLKGLGHDLQKAWGEFKRQFSVSASSNFDNAVKMLDEHELLRYPDRVFTAGAPATAILLDFTRPTTPAQGTPTPAASPRPKEFKLYVDDLDALAKFILHTSGFNAPALTCGLKSEALTLLKRDNKSQIW
jgi:HEPN domain-containing protein